MTELSGYVLETLREGSAFALYRGRRPGDAVPILVRAPISAHETSAALRWLEHEYALADELDPAWAARPVALTRHNGRTMLVLEDPGGDPLAGILGRPLALGRFLRIAVALTAAMRHVHQRGLIHKHIGPANVLVDQVDNVHLTGFGIASRLLRERQAPAPPEVIAGTFPYMAPEQTGRMNRSIDSRSDLYALGVTFYEMLTGVLPFAAADAMEWIHCHIARQPPAPGERVAGLPAVVEAIVLKLLAKTAEERYQTAAGVEADLRRCLVAYEERGGIAPFALGGHDLSDRLLVPETLYGREAETAALLAAFERVVSGGTTELVVVSGYAGIGKSSLVNELHKELVPPRGLFVSGKFDQYKRNIPYATVAQAFQGLVHQILGKSDAELAGWRAALVEALGPNGQLMVTLVPELALIIGEPPPVADLPPQDQQARFQWVLRRFLGVFAQAEHPLALFLDDLQWLDTATLDLIEHLITDPQVRHLLLIGAFRDNEVGPAHPLARMLARLGAGGPKTVPKTVPEIGPKTGPKTVHEIVLAPFRPADVARLIADALRMAPARVRALADLVFEKTAGNPFFTIQFLTMLAEEALLAFDPGPAAWTFDLARIRAKGFTDNVADLMAAKLKRLPPATQTALGQLACLGNAAEAATLALLQDAPEAATHAALFEAVRAGLVVRAGTRYAFLHDRIQEAAYALIAAAARAPAHLRIARLLAARTTADELEEQIFDIVNQFDRSAALIATDAEREQVAALNLTAGRRAKAATAYAAALQYFATGRALLGADGFTRRYRLTFDLELNWAECEYLTGALASAEQRLAMLQKRAATTVDSAAVACVRINLYTNLDRSDDAVAVGLEYLRETGDSWPVRASADDVRQDFDRLWRELGDRAIEALLDLPPMNDPDRRATMDVLTVLTSPALFTDLNLFRLVVCRMAALSLEHGNTDGSGLAYAWLGGILGTYFGDYDAGYRFGRLGLDLVEKRGLARRSARVCLVFAVHVAHWSQHLPTCQVYLQRAFEAAQEAGDLTYAAYCCADLVTNRLASGNSLDQLQREAGNALEFVQKLHFGLISDIVTAQFQLVRALRGLTADPGSFNDAECDELAFERRVESNPRLVYAASRYWIRKLQACVFAGDSTTAVAAASKGASLLWTVPTQVELSEYHFYAALAYSANCDLVPPSERSNHLKAIADHHRQISTWAQSCPPTFANRAALIGAEMARLEGRDLDAMRLYDDAIRSARDHGFVQNEGLANELAARFYAARSFEKIAQCYLRDARSCYLRWGADGKVEQLDRTYPYLRPESAPLQLDGTIGTPVDHLDLATIIKVSRAVLGEIDLDRLMDTLMAMAIEHAGADRGLLLLARGDDLWIEAEAKTSRNGVEVVLRQLAATPAEVPQSVLRTVAQTHHSVILADAQRPNPFSWDEYIRERRGRSILCLPLTKQAKLIGVLYLENSLASDVFTPARIAVLNLLASQAAISLENARLYADLQHADAYLGEAQRISHTGSFGWSVSSGEIFWSEETFQIFGVERTTKPTLESVIQRTHPDDIGRVRRFIDRAPHDGRDWDLEYRLTMPDGSVKNLHVVAHAVRDDTGDLEFVGAVMDITAAKQAQEALQQAQSELAHVARVTMLGELAASIAHEINQPLAAIVTNGEASQRWLMRSPPDIDEVRLGLQRMIGDANRAGDVIRRLRTLSKRVETERVRLDLNEVVAEAATLVHGEVIGNGVLMRLDLAADLPQVRGDRVQLQQVIINFVINGIQAMAHLDGRPRVLWVRSRRTDVDRALVEVQDSGNGIEPEHASRLFDAFFTTKPNGMGLGLSICRSIIEAHGGHVSASSQGGAGAVFQFTLPSIESDPDDSKSRALAHPHAASLAGLGDPPSPRTRR
jgi:PAS domain S-box-containing protein